MSPPKVLSTLILSVMAGCGMRRWDTAAVSVGQYLRLPKRFAKVDRTVNSMVWPMAVLLCPWEAGVLIIMLLTLITLPWILMRSLHLTLSPAGVVLVVSCVRQSLSRDEHLIPGITDLIRSCWADGESGVLSYYIRIRQGMSTCRPGYEGSRQ